MNEVLKNKLNQYDNNIDKYNYLREHLQLLILKILDERGYFRHIAFVGGTALRILYDLNRFSEDLDFCLIDSKLFSFRDMLKIIEKDLTAQNFIIETNIKDDKTVASAFIKFKQLLSPLGLSPHKEQNLSIKLEVDKKPPVGYKTEFTMINKEFLIGINHYNLPSLFAGKLHAILCRSYTKGRDYYDLIWFLGRKIEPNYNLLNQAIKQTEHTDINLNHEKLIVILHKRIQETDFKKVKNDIAPFLSNNNELRYFEKDYFLEIVK